MPDLNMINSVADEEEMNRKAYANMDPAKANTGLKKQQTNGIINSGLALAGSNPYTGNLLDTTIGPPAGVDRIALARKAGDDLETATESGFQANVRDTTNLGAARGQIGSGMLRGRLGDVVTDRNTRLTAARENLLNQAIEGSIGDSYKNIDIATQQQGFQAGRSDNAFSRELALAQQKLSEQLGMGNLALGERQQTLSETLGIGNLTLDQARQKLDEQVRLGQLTVQQRDQALREKEQADTFGLNEGNLTGTYGGKKTLASEQFDKANQNAQLGMLVQLAQLLGGTQQSGLLQELLKRLGFSQGTSNSPPVSDSGGTQGPNSTGGGNTSDGNDIRLT